MSPQIAFLTNLIAGAQTGSDSAVAMLRRICSSAAEKAPAPDLIALAQCLVHLGVEATRNELGRN